MNRTLFIVIACMLVTRSAFALEPDPIDALTGEQLDRDGRVPPRVDDLSSPSYALLNDETLWQEIVRSSHRVLILVKRPTDHRGFFRDRVLIDSREIDRTKAEMIATIRGVRELRDDRLDLRLPRTHLGMVFPGFYATIESYAALQQLRRHPGLDYIEPYTFLPMDSDTVTGCGYEPYTADSRPEFADENVNNNGGADLVPYTFRHLGITNAWKRIAFAGLGVTAMVLDTGISTQQDQLQSRFTIGAARPAPVHTDSTGHGLEDNCGHGTKVAALLAAPKDGKNIVGALPAVTLLTDKVGDYVTHLNFPVIDPDATSSWVCGGVAKAVAGNAQIVTMAFGFAYASPVVQACIASAFDAKPIIFIGAAGTGVPYVIFPASMNREVVAVSAVEIVGASSYELFAGGIAYGPEVDFVSVMGKHRIPTAGKIGNATTQEIAAGGGTSAAVPHIAAIFGLAIQSLPSTATRAQVISRVHDAASLAKVRDAYGQLLGPNLAGAGIPDAYAVAGGTTRFDITGPSTAQVGQAFTYAGASNGGALSYVWTYVDGMTVTQQHTQTVTFPARSSPGSFQFSVVAIDPVDGKTFTLAKTVAIIANPVPPPTIRDLQSVAHVEHNPSWGSGGQYDQTINAGVSMPDGCAVVSRVGRLQCFGPNYSVVDCANTVDETLGVYGARGFLVGSYHGAPNRLDTNVHFWHDGLEGIAVRVKYKVSQPHGVSCDVVGHTKP